MSSRRRHLVVKLMRNKDIRRICGFQSSKLALPPLSFFVLTPFPGAFRTFAPKLFKAYVTDLKALFERDPALRHNFTNSVFPAVTFNLGPASTTFEHVDFHNNPLGWCGITNGGRFDYTKGGHIYLKQLKLVVEFPPAATALIPSAVMDHGNTPLSPDETRYSITQYAAGGLFRWVQYGYKTAKDLLAQEDGAKLKAALDGAPGERARWGLGLFSKVGELAADHATSFNSI